MKQATTLLFAILILGLVHSALAQKAETPNATKLNEEANEALQLLVKEDFETLYSRMTGAAQKELPPKKLKEFWREVIAEAGPFEKVLKSEVKEGARNSVVALSCEFEKGKLLVRFGINSEHKISGLDVDDQ
jgi:hypothetical protein